MLTSVMLMRLLYSRSFYFHINWISCKDSSLRNPNGSGLMSPIMQCNSMKQGKNIYQCMLLPKEATSHINDQLMQLWFGDQQDWRDHHKVLRFFLKKKNWQVAPSWFWTKTSPFTHTWERRKCHLNEGSLAKFRDQLKDELCCYIYGGITIKLKD